MRKLFLACTYALCAAAGICLFLEPEICTAGIYHALTLCAKTLIPTLFPFMVVSGFFLRSGMSAVCGAHLSRLTARVFRLPGESAGILLLSMIGGFPVGIKMTAQLFSDKRITQKQAARMCLFCINAGPAFVISAVGAGFYKSTKIGVLLYGALCLSALTLGVLLRFSEPKQNTESKKDTGAVLHVHLATALTDSVRDALQCTMQICAWVSLFGGISALFCALPLPEKVQLLLLGTVEITNGVAAAAGCVPLPFLSALLAFSGFAVHCQVLADLHFCGVKYSRFLLVRLLGAGLSALYCWLLLQIFPCDIITFANSAPHAFAAVSVSVPSGAALLLMSVLWIAEVETKKKICYNGADTYKSGYERNGKDKENGNRAEMRILHPCTPLSRRGNRALRQKGRDGQRQQMPKI